MDLRHRPEHFAEHATGWTASSGTLKSAERGFRAFCFVALGVGLGPVGGPDPAVVGTAAKLG
jgi:hypothetical protein